MLDYGHADISRLIAARGWAALPAEEKIKGIYNFVKDEIKFGYNADEHIPASQILRAGYGQCNTKSHLLMALLRGCGVPCRFHAFLVKKELQRGALKGIVYRLAPRRLQHSWVEVQFHNDWLALEGVILDSAYIEGVRCVATLPDAHFCGFAIATDNFRQLSNEWRGTDTFVQRRAILDDLGVFESPDDYHESHRPNLRGVKAWLWRLVFCRRTNANVQRIREQGSGVRATQVQQFGSA